jgi:pumilio RNA-binding family
MSSRVPSTPSPTYVSSYARPLSQQMLNDSYFVYQPHMMLSPSPRSTTCGSSPPPVLNLSDPASKDRPSGKLLLQFKAGSTVSEGTSISISDSPAGLSATQLCSAEYFEDFLLEVVEFAVDQHGSRVLQILIETVSVDKIEDLYLHLLPAIEQLTLDPFGNYVVQKLLERLNPELRGILADQLLGKFLILSVHTYGCRVVQRLLDLDLGERGTEFRAALMQELRPDILRLIGDQNGNHVIQKCIEKTENIDSIQSAISGHVKDLGLHCYGCRVIQRLLERLKTENKLASEILANIWPLSSDQFGNYVVQHLLLYGSNLDREFIVREVAKNVINFACHKFASNVAERALIASSESGRAMIIAELLKKDGNSNSNGDTCALHTLTKDRFANYVVQRCVEVSTGSQRQQILLLLKKDIGSLKKITYGKHIANAVERALQ